RLVNLADKPFERMPPERVRELGESAALPRVDARLVSAFARLHDRRAAPVAFELGGAAHMLHWVYDERAAPPHDVYPFRLGMHAGRLGLDMPTRAALLGEARPERCPKPLRAVLLADALQGCTAALAAATRLPFEWTPDDEGLAPGDPQAIARFRVAEAG